MENLRSQLTERERQSLVNERSRASIKSREIRSQAVGYAVMAGFLSYGEAAHGEGVFSKITHVSKLFCILFAMLVPSLLIWQVLL